MATGGPPGTVLLSLTSNRLDVGEIRSTQSIPEPLFRSDSPAGTAKKERPQEWQPAPTCGHVQATIKYAFGSQIPLVFRL
jgi:hypothetical protein